ncbi:futalosine hydrolase [Desulfonatronum thiosulfatophilum]|uniref:Futalosine hydrolase n=1 Tax=Desulfonatronum thiosulfatophilum TaxID=617002 RepID=A0A1G6AYC0_9BACT|nr:futalosine hydrolase [Desulfonatronum thiosulfatophilum]SDB13375.1 futalosine hydrolase [Desulfonatronum thiosulfatophilum]
MTNITGPDSDHPSTLVVVTATVMEMRAVFAHWDGEIPEELGWVERRESWGSLVLLVCGVGPVNAGISLGHLLGGLPGPVGVLNLGVAGAFCLETLPLGKAVLVDEEIWPEYGLLTASGIDPKGIGLSLGKAEEYPVWDRLKLEPEVDAENMKLDVAGLSKVSSLTVSGVSGTAERAEELRTRYAADVENMEGFALAWACRRFKAPFVQVRTISNLVGSRDAKHWDLPGAKRRLAEITRVIFQRIDMECRQ